VAPDLPFLLLTLVYEAYFLWISPLAPGQTATCIMEYLHFDLFFRDPIWIVGHNFLHAPLVLLLMAGGGWALHKRGHPWGARLLWFALETILITVMHANNETGTIQPIAAIGEIARQRGIPFHSDAAQSVGKIPTRVDDLRVDLLTVAGHKLYAPKGVGALYVRRGVRPESLIHGAGHEGGRRAGTENVAGIVALGEACRIARENLDGEATRLRGLRDRLRDGLAQQVGAVHLNGHPTERLPNTLNVSFTGVDSGGLLAALPDVAASTGSACHAGHTDPSPVLRAMGLPDALALGAVRFSLGRWTTEEEVDRAVQLFGEYLRRR